MSLAIYARVSSDRQREEGTIGSQVQHLREFAASEDLVVDERHIYLDDGRSGYYLERPGLDALRDAARDGLVDTVLVHDPDRLSRKYAYQVLLLEEFARWQVKVRFLHSPPAESPEQRLLVQIQGVIAEYERTKIVERSRRGKLYWARQGRPVSGRVPYGYRRLRPDRDQPPEMVVDPVTAPIVQQMFHWYAVDGLSDRQIVLHLNNMATPPRRRNGVILWHPGSVRSILINDAYLGIWYANRYKNQSRGGRVSPRQVLRPREDWIPIPIPALIDPELFAKAQQIRESGVHKGPYRLKNPETHLLRRLVVCGHCNRKMNSVISHGGRHLYYWCRGDDPQYIRPRRTYCPHPTVAARGLDELVWKDVVSLLQDPQLLLNAWRKQHRIPADSSLTAEHIKELKRRVRDAERQLERLLDAYQRGVIELGELTSRRRAIEQRLESAQGKLEELSRGAESELSIRDLERNIDEVCRRLSGQLKGMGMRRKMALCRQLIDKVVVKDHDVQIFYKLPVSGNYRQSLNHRHDPQTLQGGRGASGALRPGSRFPFPSSFGCTVFRRETLPTQRAGEKRRPGTQARAPGRPGRLPARAPHRTVRADFPHTAPQVTVLLQKQNERF
jgi:site-specific DNA recombinase